MIELRRAEPDDAVGMAAVHVGAWRSAYAGILPDDYLARLSLPRQAHGYLEGITGGRAAYVAVAEHQVIGFVTADRSGAGLADGEIHTLYVHDDWREQGVGRRLVQRAAARLARAGCRSVFVWVLRDNPSRWFYQRLGGRKAAESTVPVAGKTFAQTAYVWNPIELLLPAPAQS